MNKTNREKQAETSLFSYTPGNSIFYKIPAFIKIVVLCFVSIRIFSNNISSVVLKIISYLISQCNFLCNSTTVGDAINLKITFNSNVVLNFTYYEITAVFYAVICVVLFFTSGLPLKRLRNLKYVLVIGLFVTILQCINFNTTPSVLFDGIRAGILYTIRLGTVSLLALITFETTTRLQIQDSFETLESLLQKIFPPFRKISFALAISVTIGFIPEIFATWSKIQKASLARIPCKKLSVVRRIEIFLAQISALFSCMLSKAEQTRRALVARKLLQ